MITQTTQGRRTANRGEAQQCYVGPRVCSPEGIIGLGNLEPLPDYQEAKHKPLSLYMADVKESPDDEDEVTLVGAG